MATSEMATPLTGNTKQSRSKSRNFILTVNEKSLEHYEDIKNYITGLKTNIYYLCCEHIGQENKHYHIYCQFNNPVCLSVKRLYGAHIETSFGSAQKNIAYLKCEDEKHLKLGIKSILIDEEGEPKLNGGFKTIKEVKTMSKEDRDELPIQYYNIVNKINQSEEVDIDINEWMKDIKVYWISGPSGIGKSKKAKEIILSLKDKYGTKVNMIKYENGFYNGVGTAKIALYDDFRDSHMKPSEFINLIDYNKHYMNIKGGQKLNEYNLIIFTTVQRLENIYLKMLDEEPRQQWERRIEEIKLGIEEDLKENDFDINDIEL